MPSTHQSPRIVAIETSSALGSVALAEGDELRAVAELATTARHCQNLMPTIDALCRQTGWRPNDLDQVFVSAGPGSFTGLRISITIAKTLATALGLHIVAVPTMRVIAARAESLHQPPDRLAVVLDAKRRQVYASLFQLRDRQYQTVLDACLMTPAELLERAPRPLTLTGEGLTWHADAFQGHTIDWLDHDHRMPRAREVHRIGRRMAKRSEFTPPNDLIPIYIRIPEAEEKWAERHRPAPPS